MILAIDPGNSESAYMVLDDLGKISRFGKVPNDTMLAILDSWANHENQDVVIEMIASYGMPVGREVFETCLWIGRYIQVLSSLGKGTPHRLMFRKDVKGHICGSSRATDANIRRELLDRFGPPGTKKSPGATYGLKADIWAALAVAVTFFDRSVQKRDIGCPKPVEKEIQ